MERFDNMFAGAECETRKCPNCGAELKLEGIGELYICRLCGYSEK